MPNHCMNKISMVFKEEESAKQLKTDLENLGSHKDNLCQLVFPYDFESKKMTFPDGSVKTLEEGLGCPAGEYWGTKWGTYDLSLDVDIDDANNDGYILEYDFDTAWGPVSTEVLSELFKKYDLTSIVNNYWEPSMGFAGTRYSCDSSEKNIWNASTEGICDTSEGLFDTEYRYDLIYAEDVDYASFVELVVRHHVDQLTLKQLKALFKAFKDYECMYLFFEKRAYEAFVNEKEQPMFNTFIANNLS